MAFFDPLPWRVTGGFFTPTQPVGKGLASQASASSRALHQLSVWEPASRIK